MVGRINAEYNKKALIVAVSNYDDTSKLRPLEFCKNDGQEMYSVLKELGYDIPDTPSRNFTGSHSRQQYITGLFTAADFPAPTAETEGNLKRNIYRNPGLVQVDASVLKNTHIPWMGEQGNLQFRFDFLNVFNHVNLGSVDNFMGDANFGRVTTALSARQLQLGARISF